MANFQADVFPLLDGGFDSYVQRQLSKKREVAKRNASDNRKRKERRKPKKRISTKPTCKVLAIEQAECNAEMHSLNGNTRKRRFAEMSSPETWAILSHEVNEHFEIWRRSPVHLCEYRNFWISPIWILWNILARKQPYSAREREEVRANKNRMLHSLYGNIDCPSSSDPILITQAAIFSSDCPPLIVEDVTDQSLEAVPQIVCSDIQKSLSDAVEAVFVPQQQAEGRKVLTYELRLPIPAPPPVPTPPLFGPRPVVPKCIQQGRNKKFFVTERPITVPHCKLANCSCQATLRALYDARAAGFMPKKRSRAWPINWGNDVDEGQLAHFHQDHDNWLLDYTTRSFVPKAPKGESQTMRAYRTYLSSDNGREIPLRTRASDQILARIHSIGMYECMDSRETDPCLVARQNDRRTWLALAAIKRKQLANAKKLRPLDGDHPLPSTLESNCSKIIGCDLQVVSMDYKTEAYTGDFRLLSMMQGKVVERDFIYGLVRFERRWFPLLVDKFLKFVEPWSPQWSTDEKRRYIDESLRQLFGHMQEGAMEVLFVPHMLSAALADSPLDTSIEVLRANTRGRLLRLSAFPLIDTEAARMLAGTELMLLLTAPSYLNSMWLPSNGPWRTALSGTELSNEALCVTVSGDSTRKYTLLGTAPRRSVLQYLNLQMMLNLKLTLLMGLIAIGLEMLGFLIFLFPSMAIPALIVTIKLLKSLALLGGWLGIFRTSRSIHLLLTFALAVLVVSLTLWMDGLHVTLLQLLFQLSMIGFYVARIIRTVRANYGNAGSHCAAPLPVVSVVVR